MVSYFIELAVSELFYVNVRSPEKHLQWYIWDTFWKVKYATSQSVISLQVTCKQYKKLAAPGWDTRASMLLYYSQSPGTIHNPRLQSFVKTFAISCKKLSNGNLTHVFDMLRVLDLQAKRPKADLSLMVLKLDMVFTNIGTLNKKPVAQANKLYVICSISSHSLNLKENIDATFSVSWPNAVSSWVNMPSKATNNIWPADIFGVSWLGPSMLRGWISSEYCARSILRTEEVFHWFGIQVCS